MTRTSAPPLATALLATILAIAPHAAWGAWPHDPALNVPLCTAYASQRSPSIVQDGEGGAIIAWMDGRGADWDIYAQRISADGAVRWAADGVPLCSASNIQGYPVIVSDGVGGAIVAWQDQRSGSRDVYAQRVSAAGIIQWTEDGVPLSTATDEQQSPTIASDGAGGAIVVWWDYRAGNNDVYAQRISAAGAVQWTADGVGLCTAVLNQLEINVVPDGAGGAIAAWTDERSGSADIYAQRISAGGAVQWAADGVALCTAAGEQRYPTVASDGAGGVIATWLDYRASDYNIYAQRVLSSGTPQWVANGVALCTAANAQWFPTAIPDGAGGAFVTWQDYRTGDWDVYVQRVSSSGSPQWTANGKPLCTVAGDQTGPQIAPDGAGGALVCWQDVRNDQTDVYAQRISAGGTAQWTADGAALCTANGEQLEPRIVADGAGGGIATWWDSRVGDWDVYAQRADRYGYLGAEPEIAVLRDVPNDQGGRVSLAWDASWLDTGPPESVVDQYFLWRQLPLTLALDRLATGARLIGEDGGLGAPASRLLRTAAANGQTYYWEYVATVTAYGMPGYSAVVATAFDSVPGSSPLTYFMVQARASASGRFWNSAPASGCSVDNLAPSAPAPFTGEYADGTTRMSWGASTAADFATFRLYRGNSPDFTPAPDGLVAELAALSFTDVAGAPYCYKLCAVDIHGNVSGFSTLLPSGTVDVPGTALPHVVFLAPPSPNPAHGATVLRFGLPREARLDLALYDQQGRRVRSLLGGTQPAGKRALVWDGRDESGRALPAGLYFVRLATESRTFVSRLAVIH